MTKEKSVSRGAKENFEIASTIPLIEIDDTEPHTSNASSKHIEARHRFLSCEPRTAKDATDIVSPRTKHESRGNSSLKAFASRKKHNRSKSDCISDGSLRDVEGRVSSHSEFLVWKINSQAFPAPDHAELKPHWRCIGSKKTTLTRCNNFNNHDDLAVGTLTSLRGQQVSLNDLVNIAERLLCTRWHKSQAEDIGRAWSEKLKSSPETPASFTSAVSDEGYSVWIRSTSRGIGTEGLDTPHTSPSGPPLRRKSADIDSPTLQRHKFTEPGRPIPSRNSFSKDGNQPPLMKSDISHVESTTDDKTDSDYLELKAEEKSKLNDASGSTNRSFFDRRGPRRKLSFGGMTHDVQRSKESVDKSIIATKQDFLVPTETSERHQPSHCIKSDHARPWSCSNPVEFDKSPSSWRSSDTETRGTASGLSIKPEDTFDSAGVSQKNWRWNTQASLVQSDGPIEEDIIITSSSARMKSGYELNATDRALEEVLDLHQSVCASLTKKFERCKNKVAKKNWPEACDALNRLKMLNADNEKTGFLDELKRLACLVVCKQRHLRTVNEVLEDWWEKLGHSRGKIQQYKFPEMRNESKGHAISGPGVPEYGLLVGKKDPTFRNDITLRSGLKYAWDSCHEKTVIRNFVPYCPKTKGQISVEKAVEGAIKRPLLKRESMPGHEGWIYMYFFPGNFGFLKIGVTTKNVADRLRGWEGQCKHRVYLLYPEFLDEWASMPHVYRVEKLIQAELRSRRRQETRCQGCFRCHTEWFEVGLPDAKKVVQKWSSWIRSNPYEEVQSSAEGKGELTWRLRDEEQCNPRRLIDTPPSKKNVDVLKLSPPELRSRTRSSENRRPRSHSRNLIIPASRSTRYLRSSSADVRGPFQQIPTSEMPGKGSTSGQTCKDDLEINHDTI